MGKGSGKWEWRNIQVLDREIANNYDWARLLQSRIIHQWLWEAALTAYEFSAGAQICWAGDQQIEVFQFKLDNKNVWKH